MVPLVLVQVVLLKVVLLAKIMCGKTRLTLKNERVRRFCDGMYVWER
jgi:hypothetical protein